MAKFTGSGYVWISFILISRIRIRFNEYESSFFFRTIKFIFTDINFYPINIKTNPFRRKIFFIEKKVKQRLYFPDFRSDLKQDLDPEQDPDPLFHKSDPRIRINIKIKRIRNTENKFPHPQRIITKQMETRDSGITN